MFNFKKQILSPIVTDVISQIDGALKLQGVTDKVEQLLSVKEAAVEKLDSIQEREANKALTASVAGAAVAIGGALFGLLFALPALPPAAFGFFVLLSASVILKRLSNAEIVSGARQDLDQKIGDEVASLARTAPKEAAKSPRFMKAVAQTFNGAASVAFNSGPSSLLPSGPEQKLGLVAGSTQR